MACVGVKILGGQYVLVTTASSDGEYPNVICVKLGYRFVPNVNFVRADVRKEVKREG